MYRTLSELPQTHVTLHSNKHPCPQLVPSVGRPFSSALALILFHPLLPSSSRWMYLCKSENRDEGHFCSFLVEDRPPISRSSLTLHLLDLPLLLHLLLGLGKLGIRVSQPPLNLVLSSLVLKKSLLPSAYLPCDPSLPISLFSSVSLFLPLSEVFDPREPEDPVQPLGPWVNDGPTNASFCTLSYKDMDATPPHRGTFFLERIAQSKTVNSS